MAFCTKCGAQIPDEAQFCTACGANVNHNAQPSAEPNPTPNPTPNPNPNPTPNPNPQPFVNQQYQYAPNYNAGFDPADIQKNKALAAIGYLVLGIIGLVAEPKSKFVRFHANQAVVLMVFTFICTLCFIVPILGWIVGFVGYIMALVFEIMGIVNAANGNAKPLPLIGKYKIIHWD